MTTDADWPAWATDLFTTITACIDFKGLGTLQGAYYEADDRGEPDLIEVAPALAELAVPGPDDGATVWSIIHSVDLLGDPTGVRWSRRGRDAAGQRRRQPRVIG